MNWPLAATRVEIVPDNDAEADPSIPRDVLAELGPDNVLMGAHMMYVRAATWERIKHNFPLRPIDKQLTNSQRPGDSNP